ncbi:MAG: hypothetical protein HY736_09545 [Verrucomicrobia bacterium]|nr:hypothetical protein [Verrucomicrobiota bacterium]
MIRINSRLTELLVRVFLICWAFGNALPIAAQTPAGSRTTYNADFQALYEAPATGTAAFVRAWVLREVSHVPITTYVQDAALPDLCFFDSKIGEVFGDRFGDNLASINPPIERTLASSLRVLRGERTDVLRLVTAALKPRGVEVLAGVRMSDTHHRRIAWDEGLCPRFTIDHPEWVIRQPDGRTNETALDYSHPGVREHRLAIMRELATAYDIDGLELNFIRWGKHFPRDEGAAKAPIMTEFIGQVRAMLDEAARGRGRKHLVLGVRVPEGIRECWLAGLDPETWVRRGWIDYLVASPFNETSPQVRVEEFRRFTLGRAQLLASMGDMIGGTWTGLPRVSGRGLAQFSDSYGGMLMTPPEARAAASNFYAWGAEGIAFWNVGTKMGLSLGRWSPDQAAAQHERLWAWMNAAVDRKNLDRAERHYHYLPLHKWGADPAPPRRNYAWYGSGQSPLGTLSTQILHFPNSVIGMRQPYRFRMADGRNGEPVDATVRFKMLHLGADGAVEIDLNGRPVPAANIHRSPLDPDKLGLPGTQFELTLARWSHFRGDNILGVILQKQTAGAAVPYLEELEAIVP